MSKKFILCTVLALCMILIGTGYAYWTDTLNVTTRATTGDLEVKFVDLGAYAQYANEEVSGDNWSIIDGINDDTPGYLPADFFRRGTNTYNDVFGNPDQRNYYYDEASGFHSVEFDAELDATGDPLGDNYPNLPYGAATNAGDTISITLDNLYPGYAQAFRSDIINIGSIAAKLSTVEFNVSKIKGEDSPGLNSQTKDLIGVALLVEDENNKSGEPAYGEIVKLASHFSDDEIFTLGGVDFVRLSALDDITDIEENLILVPAKVREHRVDMFIGIAVDPDEDGEYTTGTAAEMTNKNDSKTQEKGVVLDVKFGWDQFNVGVEAEATNILENQNSTIVQD